MFRIMTKYLSVYELRMLEYLWIKMRYELYAISLCHKQCDICKYKRLCKAIESTQAYLNKTLKERETQT